LFDSSSFVLLTKYLGLTPPLKIGNRKYLFGFLTIDDHKRSVVETMARRLSPGAQLSDFGASKISIAARDFSESSCTLSLFLCL
jgi:hypothetical protein